MFKTKPPQEIEFVKEVESWWGFPIKIRSIVVFQRKKRIEWGLTDNN